jgi:arylsulfatase A-like enzyme
MHFARTVGVAASLVRGVAGILGSFAASRAPLVAALSLVALGGCKSASSRATADRSPSAGGAVAERAAQPTGDDGEARGASTNGEGPPGGSDAPGANAAKRAAPPGDLNIVVISIDSLRADMPWSGYARPIAPRLTELESRAVSYTRAYAISSYTSMSLGGLLGGRLPSELERDGYFFGTYTKKNLFFPEVLQAAGIRTAGAHAHGYFERAGFDQGFDDWKIVPKLKWNNTTDENITSPELEAIVERQLEEAAATGKRFFSWVHFLDPHDQYKAHEGIGPYGKTLRDRYDAEVTFTDRYVGKLVDFIAAQPWGARTAIVVTSDHGEAFGEHNQYAHGFELWENLVRVPMFFLVPGATPRRIDTPRSAIDIAPTVLELFGLPSEPSFVGTSLVPEIYGGEAPARDVVLDLPETSDNGRRRALVRGARKAIRFEGKVVHLFDLERDPDERSPITKGYEHKEFADALRAVDATVKDVAPTRCRESCLNRAYLRKDAGAGK